MVAVSLLQVKKIMLGQVVPNFTGQVIAKYCEFSNENCK